MPISAEQAKEAQAIRTPEAFVDWYKTYFDGLFRRGRWSEKEGLAQFLLAQHPDWIPFFLNLAVKYLQPINRPETFSQMFWSLVGNPLVNAAAQFNLDNNRAVAEARKCKAYVKLLIDKINEFGWDVRTFRNALSALGISGEPQVQRSVQQKKKKVFLFFTKTIPEEVTNEIPTEKEEILAKLTSLL